MLIETEALRMRVSARIENFSMFNTGIAKRDGRSRAEIRREGHPARQSTSMLRR
jgi:hypothetical protein